MCKPESILENDLLKIRWDFEIQMDHLILARRPDLEFINKKKRTCCFVDFIVLKDHRVKIKGSKKTNKYLGLTRELKKLCSMRLMVIPIIVGALGMVPNSLEKRLLELEIKTGGRIKINQNHRIVKTRRVMEI